jgi:polyribonucleotide nucleotidyltransferase
MVHTIELDIAGRTLRLETGRIAKQADGAIWASYGEIVVLATAVSAQTA